MPAFSSSSFLRRRLLSSSSSAAAAAPTPTQTPPKLKNLCYRHRARALAEARSALTDYLHSTRSLPFSHAELIASNSPFSLSSLLSSVPFPPSLPPSSFPSTLRRFLSFRPINEFDFFFESIGLPLTFPNPNPNPNPYPNSLFLSDDPPLLAAVTALASFGFPWTRLGLLYGPAVLRADPARLLARLRSLDARLGSPRRVCLIAACLAFPSALTRDSAPGDGDGDGDGDGVALLFADLRAVFVDFGLAASADNDVDAFLRICRRIRVFYDSGSPKGSMGELMGKNPRVLLEFDESVLAQKLNFFARLGMEREEIGKFLLQNPKFFDFDLENPTISMPGYLRRLGLCREQVAALSKSYPYIMGRNKLGNLPGSMRAMGMAEWFLSKIVDGNHHFLSSEFVSDLSHDEKIETDFVEGIEKTKSEKREQFVDSKVEFLLGVGFGQNKITARAVAVLTGTKEQLDERFDCLLEIGVEYPMLCRMISASPKILNQSKEMLQEKVDFLCNDLSYSLEYLDSFPAFLCFDLENRIKPRYRILNWLQETGLLKKPFAPATVLANSERRFMVNLYSVHPAAPKQWLECFSSRTHSEYYRKNLFSPRPEKRC